MELEESLEAARIASEAGLDAMEISGGTRASGPLGPTRDERAGEAYFAGEASRFVAILGIPVGTVGGIRSASKAEELLERGFSFISMSRPLIRKPDLPILWKQRMSTRSDCISCNRCFIPGLRGKGVKCMARETRE